MLRYTDDFLLKEMFYTWEEWKAWDANNSEENRDILLKARANFGLMYTFFDFSNDVNFLTYVFNIPIALKEYRRLSSFGRATDL